jgi:hypothetical protein
MPTKIRNKPEKKNEKKEQDSGNFLVIESLFFHRVCLYKKKSKSANRRRSKSKKKVVFEKKNRISHQKILKKRWFFEILHVKDPHFFHVRTLRACGGAAGSPPAPKTQSPPLAVAVSLEKHEKKSPKNH